jgi:hypothetical protein
MSEQRTSRFPPPWTVEQIPGGYKVKDANGQSLAYVYGRETKADADIAHMLTMDEARRVPTFGRCQRFVATNAADVVRPLAMLGSQPIVTRINRLDVTSHVV